MSLVSNCPGLQQHPPTRFVRRRQTRRGLWSTFRQITQRRLLLWGYEVLEDIACQRRIVTLSSEPEHAQMEMNDQTTLTSPDAVDDSPPLPTTGKMCRWSRHCLSLSPRLPLLLPIRCRVWMFPWNDLYTGRSARVRSISGRL